MKILKFLKVSLIWISNYKNTTGNQFGNKIPLANTELAKSYALHVISTPIALFTLSTETRK